MPLLAQVLPWVGHPPTRNRGTIGGSIANADPRRQQLDTIIQGEPERVAAHLRSWITEDSK